VCFLSPADFGESRPKPNAIWNAIDNLQAERLIPRRRINSLEQQNNRTTEQELNDRIAADDAEIDG
jgi:hypothetical protein